MSWKIATAYLVAGIATSALDAYLWGRNGAGFGGLTMISLDGKRPCPAIRAAELALLWPIALPMALLAVPGPGVGADFEIGGVHVGVDVEPAP